MKFTLPVWKGSTAMAKQNIAQRDEYTWIENPEEHHHPRQPEQPKLYP
jgi:hypothetical protein